MIYATFAQLQGWAAFYGVTVPATDAAAQPLLKLASRDVDNYLGTAWNPLLLAPEQVAALADGAAIQAVFRSGQGAEFSLGLDDGIAALGGVSFSIRQPARFSPDAAEALAGFGLFVRSGTVETVNVYP